jgi:glutamyl-tRNA(Gln) amidotransferase subunit D
MECKPGDLVEVKTEDENIIGILMPRPEILDPNILVIKLDNGYNIGIDKSKIKSITLKEPYERHETHKRQLKHNPSLPNVTIISTGGTISSKLDYRTGGVYADYTAEDFVEMLPELENIANLKAKSIMHIMSEDMCYEHWKAIAEAAAEELNNGADGVIITQGTDTLHFSTAAVSFFLPNLSKPVVFTAAQRSIDRGSTDAFMNLICAVHAAAKSGIAEVMTCMHASMDDESCVLIRGTKVRKMHTSRRDAFRAINDIPIAKVHKNGKIEYLHKNFRPKTNEIVESDTKFEEKVALITVYPGMDPEIIDFYLDKGYKGIVLAATALGHVPVNGKHSLLDKLERARQMEIPVVIATQTLYGRVNPHVYTNLRKLSVGRGCIFVEDMLPETAYLKLGFVLGHEKGIEAAKKMMLQNLHGEMTERSEANEL